MLAVAFGWHQKRLAAEAGRWGRHLLTAQEEERQRIARELHDDAVHQAHAIGLALDRGDIAAARVQVEQIAGLLRGLAHDLHPVALEFLNLAGALRDLVDRWQAIDGLEVSLDVSDSGVLSRPAALALYRVAQEGLVNALKHARATHVALKLSRAGDTVRLEVLDDGIGLSFKHLTSTSFGMRSMRERLNAVGGALSLGAGDQGGTVLRAEVRVA